MSRWKFDSAIEEIAEVNDVRQNVGLRRDGRGRGGNRQNFGSKMPQWKKQLSGVRAAATLRRKREKES